MPNKYLPVEQILTLLSAAPPRIATLADGLPPEPLRAAPAPGEWSANAVLAHLRACADVWGGCIARIIAEDRPVIRAVNPRTWIKQTGYPQQEFQPSLHAFTAQRENLLAVLKPLAPDAWSRSAVITGAGAPLERTVHSYAQWLAAHERTHLKQIERIIKSLRQ